MNIMRKTRFRKWTMVMVCAFWLMGALPQNAVAADMVAATISPDITIWIDGAERSFFFSRRSAGLSPFVSGYGVSALAIHW